MGMMYIVFLVSAIIIVAVIAVTAMVTTKAYGYKHTIDPIENNPNIQEKRPSEEK
ncbi:MULTISPECIES: YtzI protein [Bacillaceae]|uniref:YtzI protein n=1 Tax=Bacillaceae TaxID=186817 RepID=UPI000A888D61|nr:YtzI protein [Bacillus sp. FJAT-27916]